MQRIHYSDEELRHLDESGIGYLKRCTKCRRIASYMEFGKDSKSIDGFRGVCKLCNCKSAMEWKNRPENKDYKRKMFEKFPERRALSLNTLRAWKIKNKQHIKQYTKAYRARNKSIPDINRRIGKNVRARIVAALKASMVKKSATTTAMLGCTPFELKQYLESLFHPGMSWSNYGKEWQIDHIMPVGIFNFTIPRHKEICFHWTNLQPLWKKENAVKGKKWDGSFRPKRPMLPSSNYESGSVLNTDNEEIPK